MSKRLEMYDNDDRKDADGEKLRWYKIYYVDVDKNNKPISFTRQRIENETDFDDDLIYYSNENIESYAKVGEEVGNVYKQKKLQFIKSYNIKRHVIGFLNKLIEFIIKLIIKINKKYLNDFNLEIV